jgi:pimeloyl-ACP methyl ester carboxylesterase/DNA-binding SARP family transcriptional activator
VLPVPVIDPLFSPIRFAPARGARLAYQVVGDGPRTIMSIPPLAQNIEMAAERLEIRRMLKRFGAFSRFIHFDKRGTGCSDRRSRVNGIDERVDDLRAVMDDAGVNQAHLYANSEGGPMAILFAVTFPERVLSLTLHGSGPSLVYPNMSAADREAWLERRDRMLRVWGTNDSPIAEAYAPSLAGDPSFVEWHRRYERNSATVDSLRDLLDLTLDMDVREVLGRVAVPTLVIHRTDDPIIPVTFGRELAEAIPGARLFEQPGADHFSYAGDVDGWMDEMERFIAGSVTSPSVEPISSRVRVVTLGRFAVVRDGVDVETSEWGSRLARQLCKRLVVARGWPVTRDELMDLLWPGEDDRTRLSARLSVQLSAVRRVLGGGVVASRESVSLDLAEVSTDLEALFEAGDDSSILAAFAGLFLPEDVYEDWTGPMRDAVRSRFVGAARREMQRLTQERAHARVAEIARRVIEVDRYDVDGHSALVASLVAGGDIGQARTAHDAWRAAMADLDMDVTPFEQMT